MKIMQKPLIALLLLLTMVLCTVATACGTENSAQTDNTTKADITESTAAETEVTEDYRLLRENLPDSLPSDLDFEGMTLNLLVQVGSMYDFTEEDTGDVVISAIYNRQLKVCERLNMNYTTIPVLDGDFEQFVSKAISAQDHSFDGIFFSQWRTATLVGRGFMMDLRDANYLDFSQPWWNEQYMDEAGINGSRFLLGGDASLDQISYMSCCLFNKQRFTEYTNVSTDELYQLVLDGDWTFDTLKKFNANMYSDINGNGERDDDDMYGAGLTLGASDNLVFSSGVHFTKRNSDGIPEFDMGNDRVVQIVETLYDLYYEDVGSHAFVADFTLVPQKMVNNEITFMMATFRDCEGLRDMEADYGLIPNPKLDDTIEGYRTLPRDSGKIWSLPVDCTQIDPVCAFIEATAAENYRTVMPAYYDVALKVKYTRDEMSAQMIDIIHDNLTTDFAYVYNYALNSVGTILRSLLSDKSSNVVSYYAKMEKTANTRLDKLVGILTEAQN